MSVERARVVEVYARVDCSARVGSGYLVADRKVLTAAHVVRRVPTYKSRPAPNHKSRPPRRNTHSTEIQCLVRGLGQTAWTAAVVAWRDEGRDLAVLAAPKLDEPLGGSPLRWGRIDGVEPVACTAVGFPWAQARSRDVRDTEQLFGHVAPLAEAKTGRLAVSVVTAPPAAREGGSPWAGMSGAALFTGPYLVGVITLDPGRYGTDRVLASPVAPLLENSATAALLDTASDRLVAVGPRLRLEISRGRSLVLCSPYLPVPSALDLLEAPVQLLLPEHGIVPFAGRHELLTELESWCTSGRSVGVRLLTGAGGAGKTRLAGELCARLSGTGWGVGFADERSPGGETRLEWERPTLIVVDNADLQVPLLADLLPHLAYQVGAPPARLLLVAREPGRWWEDLNGLTNDLARGLAAPPQSLQTGRLELAQRMEQRDAALGAFTAHLPEPSSAVALPDLIDPAFANPLLVHMRVLVALLSESQDHRGEPAPGSDEQSIGVRARVLRGMLNRERERWRCLAPADLGETVQVQAVAIATLTAANSRDHLVELLRALPDLTDAPTERRGAVADWLHALYPGSTPGGVAPLRPDLLAEQLLADTPQLAELISELYPRADIGQVAQLLAELLRAATEQPQVQRALDQLLATRLAQLFEQVLATPTTPLPRLLADVLRLAPQPAPAAALVERLPEHSAPLADLAAILTAQTVDHYRALSELASEAYLPDLAASLNNLGFRLAAVGPRARTGEQTQAPIEEAVQIYRALADGDHKYLPGLAMSLNNLSQQQAAVGRRKQALAAIEEAVQIYREVAGTGGRKTYLRNLATSLANQVTRLPSAGRRKRALAAIEEAWLYRGLSYANWEFLSDLATTLHNLALRRAGVGQWEQALTPIKEAVAIRRALTGVNPQFQPDLAMSLTNLSNRLSDVGRGEQALAPIEEAVQMYRGLAEAAPETYLPDLAASLSNLSSALAEVGRRVQALAPIEEAVQMYRGLAEAAPEKYRSPLAASLTNLALRLVAVGRRERALAPIEEAVQMYRGLAEAAPDPYLPDLAASLTNLSSALAEVGRREQALAPIEKAVQMYRGLAEAAPEKYRPALAASLTNLSSALAAAGRREQALAPNEEAVQIYRGLAEAAPDVFVPALRASLAVVGSLAAGYDRTRPSNLVSILTDSAARYPERTAAAMQPVRLSYRQLDEAAARVAGLLRERGVAPGDRVGLMLPNIPYFPAIYYGILRAGGIVVPLEILLRARELRSCLDHSGARLVFAWHDFADEARVGALDAGADIIIVSPGEFDALERV
ncbi:MAG: tetratricopeptide repeat protein [Mycobacterium leprae]